MRKWTYTPARDLDLHGLDRLASPRRERGLIGTIGHACFLAAARTYLALYHRMRVEGRSHLPAVGPLVIVANHTSHLDAIMILAALPRRLRRVARPVSAADTFFTSLPRAGLASVFIDALAIKRGGTGRQQLAQLRERLTEEGCCLIVFPEGTRTRTGEPCRFRHGVGAIVAGTGIPVVPCFVRGAGSALPPGARVPRPKPVGVRFGESMRCDDESDCREGWKQIAESLEAAVLELAKSHR